MAIEATRRGAKRQLQQCDKDKAATGEAGRSGRGKCDGVCDVTPATQSTSEGPAALTRVHLPSSHPSMQTFKKDLSIS